MSNVPVRAALVGFGFGGKVFHAPFVTAVGGFELAAIVVRSQARRELALRTYPAARIFDTPEEAFSDPSLDLIVISTPNETHFPLAAAALRAGKHVVIDKPFASTSQQARELIDIATKTGKVLAPFHNRRHDGDFLTLKKLLSEGTLGRVVTVASRFDRYRPLQRPNTWKETGSPVNGLLFDLGPHLVDQALALFGSPTAITASVRMDRDQTDIDDAFDILLEYPQLRYTCNATMLAAAPAPRFTVHGTHGSYVKTGVDPQEAALISGAFPPAMSSPTPWLPEAEAAWGTLTIATERKEPVQFEHTALRTETGDYRQFYANVRDAILGHARLAIPAEDGYRVVRLLELARESSDQHTSLPVVFD